MKIQKSAVLVLGAALLFSGCESTRHDIAGGVREKFSGPVYERRVFDATGEAVFDAALARTRDMGFRVTRSGQAQGVIEGVSGIVSDDTLRGSRQRTIKVKLSPVAAGGVEVAVLFTEIVEDEFGKGAGSESSMRGDALYAVFYDGLGQLLGAGAH